MKMTFISIISLFALLTCGNRNANSGPKEEYVAPVKELAASLNAADAAEEPQAVINWDKTVHDFGDVSVTDGPLSCTFTLTNTSKDPIAIFEVVSSCGCTDVKWTREPIQPGKSGTISATYKNEDGAMAFDKTLTVYVSGVQRPVILRLRGIVHEKKKSLSQLFGAQKLGAFGLKSRQLKTGTLRQGLETSESVTVANLGKTPLSVSFDKVSPQLSLSLTPNPIPANSTATLSYTVKANEQLYGKNIYSAVPVLNGEQASAPLEITTWTQPNFAALSEEARRDGPLPVFESSTFSFNVVKAGESIEVTFPCTNRGKAPLHFYKADSEQPALQAASIPEIAPGQKESVRLTLDTSLLPKGENVIMLSLTTNSPLRPLVNLFVAGEVR